LLRQQQDRERYFPITRRSIACFADSSFANALRYRFRRAPHHVPYSALRPTGLSMQKKAVGILLTATFAVDVLPT
jgi:hypothetical protein